MVNMQKKTKKNVLFGIKGNGATALPLLIDIYCSVMYNFEHFI